jgi:threonyl-tRNA synthetase
VEHFAGHFPLWLAPEQIRVVPVSDKNIKYADSVAEIFANSGLRITVDKNTETVEYKIRDSQLQKIPYVLVVGEKEEQNNTVAVRKAKDTKVQFGVKPEELLKQLQKQVDEKK